MFEGISLVASMKKRNKSFVSKSHLKTLKASQLQLKVTKKVLQSVLKMNQTAGEFSDLRHLKNTIFVHGINKSLMSFVNPGNKVLSSTIKNLPSNESLDSVTLDSTDSRTKDALSGLGSTINQEGTLVASWMNLSAEDIGSLLDAVEDQLDDIGQTISEYLEAFETGEVDEADLGDTTVCAVDFDAANDRFDALLSVLPDVDGVISDPTSTDDMQAYKNKIENIVESLGNICNIDIEEQSPYLVVSGAVDTQYEPKEDTASNLGYTLDSIIVLLRKCDNVVDELTGLIDRKEKMISGINDAAETVVSLDNDVPPAVDNAIVSGNPDEDTIENGSGVTQIDLYHQQTSSHLYLIAVILAESLVAVNEILNICDVLTDDTIEE